MFAVAEKKINLTSIPTNNGLLGSASIQKNGHYKGFFQKFLQETYLGTRSIKVKHHNHVNFSIYFNIK